MSQAGIKGESYFATTSSNIIIKLDSQEREIRRLVFYDRLQEGTLDRILLEGLCRERRGLSINNCRLHMEAYWSSLAMRDFYIY